ncbi:MAG: DUF47 family protein [Desulfobacterales bacterium]|nr:DUF47 family protein [Desulfobacterales bacterium]
MSFSLFPKSPKFFDLFREQNRIIVEAMELLHSMAQEFEKMDVRGQMINRLESEGDVVNREISQQLSTTFITPIDREDIHQLNASQETILNHIQAISNRICVYGKADVTETVKRLKFLKKECEMLLLSGLGELYDNPDPTPAEVMDIIKWTHVYDRIDKAFNRTWQLAKAIEGVVLKNA